MSAETCNRAIRHPGLLIRVLFFANIVVKTEESSDIHSRINFCTQVRDAFRRESDLCRAPCLSVEFYARLWRAFALVRMVSVLFGRALYRCAIEF